MATLVRRVKRVAEKTPSRRLGNRGHEKRPGCENPSLSHRIQFYLLPLTLLTPSLVKFSSCAPTSPAVISGGFGSNAARLSLTHSAAILIDSSAPAWSSKTLTVAISLSLAFNA